MKKNKKRAVIDVDYCVACGCCRKVCPVGAISIEQGVFAKVDAEKCIGCGKCSKECPASIIEIEKVEVEM